MGAPKTNIYEINQSQYQPITLGQSAGVILQAPKGQVGVARLVSSQLDLMKNYTPNGKLEVGMDLGFFSALAYLQTGPVWAVRAAIDSLYGGIDVASRGSASATTAVVAGISDPTAYTFPGGVNDTNYLFALTGANQGVWNNNVGVLLYNYHANDNIVLADFNFNTDVITTHVTTNTAAAITSQGPTWTTGEAVKFALKATGDVLPYPLVANTTYYVIEGATANQIKLATSLYNALTGVSINIGASGSNLTTNSSYTLMPATAMCKTPGCFTLQVYTRASSADATYKLVESWTLSMLHMKDGNGQNVYIDDVLQGSNYIDDIVNASILPTNCATAYPKAITGVVSGTSVVPFWFTQGSDGTSVTDDQMVNFVSALANPDTVPMKLVMDGGHASPAYQQALYTMCATRKDCFAVLSVPYTAEASSDYLNQVTNYRDITTGFDTSFAAMYTPCVKIYDKDNDRSIYVSPDGYAAAVINTAGVMPPFGLNRGQVSVLGLRRNYTSAEMDVLFDKGINIVRFIPSKGTYLWGDKTLVAVPSALDGINVRIALSVIQPGIARICDAFLGEFVNDIGTRDLLKVKIDGYLQRAKAMKLVNDYYIVDDGSINSAADQDAHTLNVEVYFKPFLSIRWINFTTIITAQGVTFSNATA